MRNGHLNLLGERFGQLTVVKELPYRINKFGKKEYMWLCQCDCGNTIEECTHSLRQGYAHKCKACYTNDKKYNYYVHGDSKSSLYRIWTGMKQRCYNPNNPDYYLYGARGITVCDEWKDDYPAFKEWAIANEYEEEVNHRYESTIDRIDPNGNYEPSNCRWVSAKTQMRNRRCTVMCYYNGELIPLAEAAELLGVKWFQLYQQWNKGIYKDATEIDFSYTKN